MSQRSTSFHKGLEVLDLSSDSEAEQSDDDELGPIAFPDRSVSGQERCKTSSLASRALTQTFNPRSQQELSSQRQEKAKQKEKEELSQKQWDESRFKQSQSQSPDKSRLSQRKRETSGESSNSAHKRVTTNSPQDNIITLDDTDDEPEAGPARPAALCASSSRRSEKRRRSSPKSAKTNKQNSASPSVASPHTKRQRLNKTRSPPEPSSTSALASTSYAKSSAVAVPRRSTSTSARSPSLHPQPEPYSPPAAVASPETHDEDEDEVDELDELDASSNATAMDVDHEGPRSSTPTAVEPREASPTTPPSHAQQAEWRPPREPKLVVRPKTIAEWVLDFFAVADQPIVPVPTQIDDLFAQYSLQSPVPPQPTKPNEGQEKSLQREIVQTEAVVAPARDQVTPAEDVEEAMVLERSQPRHTIEHSDSKYTLKIKRFSMPPPLPSLQPQDGRLWSALHFKFSAKNVVPTTEDEDESLPQSPPPKVLVPAFPAERDVELTNERAIAELSQVTLRNKTVVTVSREKVQASLDRYAFANPKDIHTAHEMHTEYAETNEEEGTRFTAQQQRTIRDQAAWVDEHTSTPCLSGVGSREEERRVPGPAFSVRHKSLGSCLRDVDPSPPNAPWRKEEARRKALGKRPCTVGFAAVKRRIAWEKDLQKRRVVATEEKKQREREAAQEKALMEGKRLTRATMAE